MSYMNHIARVAAILLAFGTFEDAAAQRLREQAREHSVLRPGEPMLQPAPPGPHDPKSIEELSVGADVVIQARLQKLKSYVNDAGRRVLTDYLIVEPRILAGGFTGAPSPTPGVAAALIMTVFGGEIVLEGVTVRALSQNLDAIHEKREYLLFLRSDSKQGRYSIYNGGIFDVSSGELTPLLKLGHEFFKDTTREKRVNEAISRIQAARGRTPR